MTKTLKLIIQPKVIDHLGIKMYQKPVDVVSEYIANSWDADSELVSVTIGKNSIVIEDNGEGMSFDGCQRSFLTVARDRRKVDNTETTLGKGRPLLGRKGIGKFAGFGVAKKVQVRTVSGLDGETTAFEMDIASILEYDAAEEKQKPIKVLEYIGKKLNNAKNHGTTVTLQGVETKHIDIDQFKAELSRRFLLPQLYTDFVIRVNGKNLPESFDDEMEFLFPRDFTDEEAEKLPSFSIDGDGWAEELVGGNTVKWRIGFLEETIEDEELRGITIYAKGKLAQKPFFFDLTGGIGGQYGLEYMTGQVRMDFVDEGKNDLIATERQRINLQVGLGRTIKDWGIDRIKLLSRIWKERRGAKRLAEVTDKISPFSKRLNNLSGTERAIVESVLKKIASFPRLGKERFGEWCSDVLTSWEVGRLRGMITKISETNGLDEHQLLDMLAEAGVLTSLNIAESIRTKILAIGELKRRVDRKDLENEVRDYVYANPWIIHPRWERFQKERSVSNIIKAAGVKQLSGAAFSGRVDLALSAGTSLLIAEFMRPDVELDLDHLDRINYYVLDIRNALKAETAGRFHNIEKAYVIADRCKDGALVTERVMQLQKEGILVMTWSTLIEQAIEQWDEYLKVLKDRYPDDPRIKDL